MRLGAMSVEEASQLWGEVLLDAARELFGSSSLGGGCLRVGDVRSGGSQSARLSSLHYGRHCGLATLMLRRVP